MGATSLVDGFKKYLQVLSDEMDQLEVVVNDPASAPIIAGRAKWKRDGIKFAFEKVQILIDHL